MSGLTRWLLIAGVLMSMSEAQMPRVYLNHFFVAPDSATFERMKADPRLKEFGVFEYRKTKRADTSYAGLYFYGTHTYFEILEPASEKKAGAPMVHDEGSVGIAFGVDRERELATVAQKLGPAAEGKLIPVTRQLKVKDATRDAQWFWMQNIKFDVPHVETWLMEYRPEFLPEFAVDAEGKSLACRTGVTRADILACYKQKLGHRPNDGAFAEVEEIAIRASKADAPKFTKLCADLGWRSTRSAGTLRCISPSDSSAAVALAVTEGEGPAAITNVKFHLKGKHAAATWDWGGLTLRFDGSDGAELVVKASASAEERR